MPALFPSNPIHTKYHAKQIKNTWEAVLSHTSLCAASQSKQQPEESAKLFTQYCLISELFLLGFIDFSSNGGLRLSLS